MAKLMGFDFEIQYKTRSSNVAADALSRQHGAELLPLLLNNAHDDLFTLIKDSWSSDSHLKTIINDLQNDPKSHSKYTWFNNELRRKGKLLIGNKPELELIILKWLHDSFVGGHSGRDITASRVKSLFYWKGMNKEIQNYIRSCDVLPKKQA